MRRIEPAGGVRMGRGVRLRRPTIRRLTRDVNERGRSVESVIDQYLTTVRPMHQEFVEASKRHADVIIPEGGFNTIAVDMVVARIEAMLEESGLIVLRNL